MRRIWTPRLTPGAVTEQDPDAFRTAVLRAQEHIARGDIYQANLSRGWRVQWDRGGRCRRLI